MREPFRVKRAAKRNVDLLRQETSAPEIIDSEDQGDNRPQNYHKAVPISTLTSTRRGLSMGDTVPTELEDTTSSSKLKEFTYDDIDDDEEAALLAAADTESTASHMKDQTISHRTTRNEPELSEGVMAALAKLRQGG